MERLRSRDHSVENRPCPWLSPYIVSGYGVLLASGRCRVRVGCSVAKCATRVLFSCLLTLFVTHYFIAL